MTTHFELPKMGEIIRRVRKIKGLRLEDLADEQISPATISNIERGVPHVKQDKLYYLMEKLGISMEQIPELIKGEEEKLQELKTKLISYESLSSMGKHELCLQKLKELEAEIDDSHPYAPDYYYIQGKCYRHLKKWRQAENAYYQAIRVSQHTPTDTEAAAFNELSLCSFYQNDLEQALQYVESGIDAFAGRGNRSQIIYILKRNKGIYLERLGRLGEAMRVVDETWDQLSEIKQVETTLVFYWLRAELSRRTGVLDQAVEYAQTGLELARLNRDFSMMFDFWTVLGSTYIQLKKWERAEHCFDMALQLKDRLPDFDEDKFIITYTRLGLLYMKFNRNEDAVIAVQKAIAIGERMNDAPHLANALHAMGDYYRLQDDRQEAAAYYRRELELAESHGLHQQTYQAMLRLAECLEEVDKKEFQQLTRNMYRLQLKLQNEEGSILEKVE